MSRVLITGVTGFIGSNLARLLRKEGYEVYGLVRHISRSLVRYLEEGMQDVRFVQGDLTSYHSVRNAIASCKPDVIAHLGALTPVRYSFVTPFPYVSINYEGTMNVVHSVLEVMPKARVLVASTAEVYGWQGKEPLGETVPLYPSSPYAVSKAAADLYVQMSIKNYGLDAIVFRCNNTYGRVGEGGFLTEYVIDAMLRSQPVYVGAPDHVREYMYVDDHVNAYFLGMKSANVNSRVFNVSPGVPVSNIKLTEELAKMTGYRGEIIKGKYPPNYPLRLIQWDTEHIVLDASRIRKELGWHPSVTLQEGLGKTVERWRKHVDNATNA